MTRRDVVLIAAFWTALAAFTMSTTLADPRGPGIQFLPPSPAVAIIVTESVLWALLTPAVFALGNRFPLERGRWPLHVALLLAVGLVLALAVNVTVIAVRDAVAAPYTGTRSLLSRRLAFANDYVIFLGVLAIGYARDYFRRFREQSAESVRLQTEAQALRAQLAESQLAALRMQLNPHFLFNTLHAMSALVERDPAAVRRMIARLSELLRATLDESAENERTVEREMAFIARYLEIMELRFQGRLQVETRIDPAVREARVPTLILQPLVENALKHGGGGRVEVSADRDGDRLRLTVRDGGPGPGGSTAAGTGVGLRNTAERLRQMYGDAQSVSLRAGEGGGAVATIELPFRG